MTSQLLAYAAVILILCDGACTCVTFGSGCFSREPLPRPSSLSSNRGSGYLSALRYGQNTCQTASKQATPYQLQESTR